MSTVGQGSAVLLAVDWGTSSLRGALLDGAGRVLHERASAQGILHVPAQGFASVFEANFADWATAQGSIVSKVLISGMAGSRQGWREAPYCACPAGFTELGRALCPIDDRPASWPRELRLVIVPGLSSEHTGVPDVLRGEEVQVFGAMSRKRARGETTDGLYVLPGTHSKWVKVRNDRIEGFQTCMTGEVFALLAQQSLLARSIVADAPLDEAAFVDGVHAARGPGPASLLATAFSVRTLDLFGRLTPAARASRLSGLVIGEELRAMAPPSGQSIDLIGSVGLCQRYALALTSMGVPARQHGSEATWAGLHALAQACGMI